MSATVAPLLEGFFTNRLLNQKQASPRTVQAYRDGFRLLLIFVQARTGKAPSDLLLDDLDAALIGDFLTHLETERGNSIRTRNARLAAIRSFFRYLAPLEPAHGGLIQRVLAIPQKRFERNIITFLTLEETEAFLAAPDKTAWIGRRDRTLLAFDVQTGLRVSEIIDLRIHQLALDKAPHVRCMGKGRKERCTPLTADTVSMLRAWLRERGADPDAPVFPSRRGGCLSRDAVERLVSKYAQLAGKTCASLASKRVSPHVLRHTTAVMLLRAGVDCSVIALWLGHESVETTQVYLAADLSMKEEALERTAPPSIQPGRYRPDDQLLAFLQAL